MEKNNLTCIGNIAMCFFYLLVGSEISQLFKEQKQKRDQEEVSVTVM